MSKVRNFSEIAPNIAFPEFNFYELYYSTFEKSELGRIKKLLPLREMAETFGLVRKSMRPKQGRKSFFTTEGKVALMFLKMYTRLSCPKLMEQLNGNISFIEKLSFNAFNEGTRLVLCLKMHKRLFGVEAK